MDLYEILEVSVSATKEKILFTFGKKISSRYEFGLSPNSPLGHQITIAGAGESPAKKPPGNLRVILVSITPPLKTAGLVIPILKHSLTEDERTTIG